MADGSVEVVEGIRLGRMTALRKPTGGVTDLHPDSTVLSVDGIGAFDLVSREAMLSGLRNMEGGDTLLPFVAQFYGRPSQYIWDDDEVVCHTILQGEGENKATP